MGSTLASHFTQPHVMEFVTTQRGARSLIYEGHKYVINRRGRDGRIFWRCAWHERQSLADMKDNLCQNTCTYSQKGSQRLRSLCLPSLTSQPPKLLGKYVTHSIRFMWVSECVWWINFWVCWLLLTPHSDMNFRSWFHVAPPRPPAHMHPWFHICHDTLTMHVACNELWFHGAPPRSFWFPSQTNVSLTTAQLSAVPQSMTQLPLSPLQPHGKTSTEGTLQSLRLRPSYHCLWILSQGTLQNEGKEWFLRQNGV